MRLAPARDWPMSTRIAALCLGATLVLDAAAVLHARDVRTATAVRPLVIPAAPRIVIITPTDADLVYVAANSTPFDATPPAPATVAVGVLPQQLTPAAQALPRLIGTVVESQGGGFVILELSDARMQVVRIGERAGGLRLRSVTAGEAVFDDLRGTRVSLRTPSPGAETRP